MGRVRRKKYGCMLLFVLICKFSLFLNNMQQIESGRFSLVMRKGKEEFCYLKFKKKGKRKGKKSVRVRVRN